MYIHATLLQVCLLLVVFSSSALAAYNDVCSSTTACDATNDHTECVYTTDCTKGRCSGCATDYRVYSGACKKDYNKACTNDVDCGYDNAKCTNSLCACDTGYTYDSTYKACAEDTKAWGDACGADTDCMVLAAAGGKCDSSICSCKAEFTKVEGYICQAPRYGETCDGTAGCGVRADVDGTPDETVPDCTSSSCVCATGSEVHTLDSKSYCTSAAAPAETEADGIQCTRNNQCDSGRCKQCPDTPGAVCVGGNSVDTIAAQPVMILVLTVIAGLLQL